MLDPVLRCSLRIRDSGNVVTFIAIVYVLSLICFFIYMVDQFPCYVIFSIGVLSFLYLFGRYLA